MKLLIRLLGFLIVLLAMIGLFVCAVGAVGIWRLQANVTDQMNKQSEKLDEAFKRATSATERLRGSLKDIRSQVAFLEKGSNEFNRGWEWNNSVRGYLRVVIQRMDLFIHAAQAATLAQRGIRESPIGQFVGLEFKDTNRITTQATEWSAKLKILRVNINKEISNSDDEEKELISSAKELNYILKQSDNMIGSWQADIHTVREELPDVKSRIRSSIMQVTIFITVAAFLLGLGQICLFRCGWRWCFCPGKATDKSI